MVNTQSELMAKAQALMKQKDDLETEIKSLQDNLKAVRFSCSKHKRLQEFIAQET